MASIIAITEEGQTRDSINTTTSLKHYGLACCGDLYMGASPLDISETINEEGRAMRGLLRFPCRYLHNRQNQPSICSNSLPLVS